MYRVCIDDFALKKRYSYGTVMVDWDTHRIIDMIPSRESTEVSVWLSTYPNILMISRDGASGYASAGAKAHPDAVQVTDRFHEGYDPIKPANDYFKKLEIPASLASEVEEIIMDGGNDIYGQIYPFWDGEDDYFDLKRVSDAELSQFENLKRMVLINSPENLGKTLINRLKKHGIDLD